MQMKPQLQAQIEYLERLLGVTNRRRDVRRDLAALLTGNAKSYPVPVVAAVLSFADVQEADAAAIDLEVEAIEAQLLVYRDAMQQQEPRLVTPRLVQASRIEDSIR